MQRVLLVAAAALVACGGKKDAATKRPERSEHLSPTELEAMQLGRDLYMLADRAHDFQATHQRRPPKGLRDLAVDSLTPELARVLTRTDSLRITVSFRRPEQHDLTSCRVTLEALEEADLNSGTFSMRCRTARGDTTVQTNERP